MGTWNMQLTRVVWERKREKCLLYVHGKLHKHTYKSMKVKRLHLFRERERESET